MVSFTYISHHTNYRWLGCYGGQNPITFLKNLFIAYSKHASVHSLCPISDYSDAGLYSVNTVCNPGILLISYLHVFTGDKEQVSHNFRLPLLLYSCNNSPWEGDPFQEQGQHQQSSSTEMF